MVMDEGWKTQLYRPKTNGSNGNRAMALTAIPYYAWANREPSPMQVWIRMVKVVYRPEI